MTGPPSVLTFGEALVGYATTENSLPDATEGRLLASMHDPEAIAAYYLSSGAQEVAVKLGAEGAQAWTANGRNARSQPVHVTAVDTVGAGDGFAAGYIAGHVKGASLQDRLNQAAAVGALVTTRRGDLTAMPSSEEVQQLLDVAPTMRVRTSG